MSQLFEDDVTTTVSDVVNSVKKMNVEYDEKEIFQYVEKDLESPTSVITAVEALIHSSLPDATRNVVMFNLLEKLYEDLGDVYDSVQGSYSMMLKSIETKKDFAHIVNVISDARQNIRTTTETLREAMKNQRTVTRGM